MTAANHDGSLELALNLSRSVVDHISKSLATLSRPDENNFMCLAKLNEVVPNEDGQLLLVCQLSRACRHLIRNELQSVKLPNKY